MRTVVKMNIKTNSAKQLDNVLKSQRRFYNHEYFDAYRANADREKMYARERLLIEGYCSSGRILDIGCGLGGFLVGFDSSRWEKYGVEISDDAAAFARRLGILIKPFEDSYEYPQSYFDVVVFRGTIQLIPNPFETILRCISLMKRGGLLIFLATPNSNSAYYRRFKILPFTKIETTFLMPSDEMFASLLKNYGLKILKINYPYSETPYARPLRDYMLFLLSYFGVKRKFPFPRSSMEIFAQKP
jgi:SAM-dependent methyltransferase